MMIPLDLSGERQVMSILEKERNGVITTGPGARGEREEDLDPKMAQYPLSKTHGFLVCVL